MAVKINLPDIESGAMYVHSFLWFMQDADGNKTAVDLTNHSAALQARSTSEGDPDLNWGTSTSEISLDGNRISIEVTADKTQDKAFESVPYDLLVWPTSNPERAVRVAYGEVSAYPVVTRLA